MASHDVSENMDIVDESDPAGDNMDRPTENEENLRYRIMEVFRVPVVNKVCSVEILPYLSSIKSISNDSSKIRAMHRGGERTEATEKLLMCIDNLNEKGKWKSFMDALEQAEYGALSNLLNYQVNANLRDDEQEKNIRLFARILTEEINVTSILPYLYGEDVIKEGDIQAIQAYDTGADKVMELLSLIHRKHKDWYIIFLESLRLNGKEKLVDAIEPDFQMLKEKYEAKKDKSNQEIIMEVKEKYEAKKDESNQEIIMEVLLGDGEAYTSGDYSINIETEHPPLNKLGSTEATKVEVDVKVMVDTSMNSLEHKSNSSDKSVGVKELKVTNTERVPSMNINEPEPKRTTEASYTNDIEADPLTLREYQDDLCKDALLGQNVIICSPTGSGKTIVAVKIIKEHLSKKIGIKKVAFLVNQVALAEQQYTLCKKYLKCSMEKLTGDIQMQDKIPLSKLIECNDVMVMTAQILVDAIKEGNVKDVRAFSLIVFDECHHAKAKHPYNQLMHMYMDVKLKHAPKAGEESMEDDGMPPPILPQVIGLTASVGVGKAKKEVDALEHIITLCANLDVFKICTARMFEDNMMTYVHVPRLNITQCTPRRNDVYYQTIVEIMQRIEDDMKHSEYLTNSEDDVSELVKLLKTPTKKKHESYTLWLTTLKRGIASTLNAPKARKFYVTCHKMLEIYHSALIVNDDCRSIDSLNCIKEDFAKGITQNQSSDTYKALKKYYTDKEKKLTALCLDKENTNPKLKALQDMITEGFHENIDSRAIVFVKTIALVHKLKVWMQETPELKELNLKPEIVTGKRNTADRGGMTRNQQIDVLECFKEGDAKLILATSVAEEGLDIRKCNLVIRYDHVTNEIAMVQSRGRARADNSQFKLVASAESNSAKKEEMNLSRELMMKQALLMLEQKSPEELQKKINEYQTQMKSRRDSERKGREGRVLSHDEFELRCFGCNTFACFSSDIRTLRGSQYTVTDPSFKKKYNIKPHQSPVEFHGFQKKNKIFCKAEGCGYDWGIEAIYRNVEFPLIKIESFPIEDSTGKKTIVKKWKNVPFSVGEIEEEYVERQFLEASGNDQEGDSGDDN